MPTLEVLDALQAIVEKLRRLGDVERGDPLRSSDWNTLVDCIRRIASTLLDRETGGSVPDHHHQDQVSVEWLDANLKRLVEKGPLHEPEAMARLGKLERELARLEEKLGESQGNLATLRNNFYKAGADKIDQAARLKDMELRIHNVPNSRQDVLSLNERIAKLGTKLDRAIAFEERLNLNGEPINFANLQEELNTLKNLREGFTNADGELWTAQTIQRELATLQGKLVTQADLELAFQRLETGGPTLDPLLEGLLETRVGTLVEEKLAENPIGTDPTLNPRVTAVESQLVSQKTTLDNLKTQVQFAANQDQLEGLAQRVKTAETLIGSSQSGQESLLAGFSQLSRFLNDFGKPPVAGITTNLLDIDALRFNVAINNNNALKDKLLSSRIDTVEKLSSLSPTELNSLLRDLVPTSERELIQRNIEVLTQR